jgi:hypothetical protein
VVARQGSIAPLCTPALVVLLGVAAGLGSPQIELVLLLAFAVARAIPIGIGAVALGWLEALRVLGTIDACVKSRVASPLSTVEQVLGQRGDA